MHIDDGTARAIGVALNEAAWLGAEYAAERNSVFLTFSVLTLPDDHSPEPGDPRRQVVLTDVGRIVASLRESYWNDTSAPAVPFDVHELLDVVRSFGRLPVYGWDFINSDDPELEQWQDRASLLLEPPTGSLRNRIRLFQELTDRHLDVWIWFEDLLVADPTGARVTLAEFTAGGQRWWDALQAGDIRTQGHGIVPNTRR